MRFHAQLGRRTHFATALMLALAFAMSSVMAVLAASLVQISSDPYTNTDSQHATQVEPDSFAFGSTIVTAVQTGRFFNGGASNINVATSTNGGATWVSTGLPGLTNNPPAPPGGGGTFDRVSDPVVAYDARHGVWMVSTLPLIGRSSTVSPAAAGVYTSRSTDGGITWGNPIFVTGSNLQSPDKNWIVCDNTAASPFYGNCYTEWDANGDGNRIYMSTSTDGGLTWGPRLKPANNATGIGGQPVVQPNGTVIVPIDNANETGLLSFRSTDGGASWSATTSITAISDHTVAGSLRTGPLPSAEIDASGKVYVIWQDCRFRTGCKSNDIVMTTSADGLIWTPIVRIPIDGTSSSVDHFIPGLAVDNTSSGATARLALTYYYYPKAKCSASTCQLNVGYISSADGGAHWSPATQLNTTPMSLSSLANTSQGRMVGDYISTSFSGSATVPAFVIASAPSGSVFNEAMYTATGLSAATGSVVVTAGGEHPVPGAASDHASPQAPITHR